MRRILLPLATILTLIAVLLGVQGCGSTPAQAGASKRFVVVYEQGGPAIQVLLDRTTGYCWLRSGVYGGWVVVQAPKEVCEVKP